MTEQTECYRLEASSIEETLFCGCIGTGGFLGLVVMIAVLGSSPCPGFIGMMICAAIGVFGFVASERYSHARGIVEIAIHGGRARWASGKQTELGSWTPVSRFEAVRSEMDQFSLRALLVDGSDVRPLGAWVTSSARRMESFVRRLNEVLCAEGRGAGTDPIWSWRRSEWGPKGPYHIELRWAGAGIPGEVLLLLLVMCIAGTVATLVYARDPRVLWIGVGVTAALLIVQGILQCGTAWVDVVDRGGPVSWGSERGPWQHPPVEVQRFEVGSSFFHRPGYRVVAILAEGERRDIFGGWRTGRIQIAEAIASELNHLLIRAPRAPSGA